MEPASVRSISSAASVGGRRDGKVVAAHDHAVQFYESDHFLVTTVSSFLGDGLSAGHPVVVIATGPHRESFLARLTAMGFDVSAARRTGALLMLDARETLDTFMVDGEPSEKLFRARVGSIIDESLRDSRQPMVRAYGEMVDLLWRDGLTGAAIRLEELWNSLRTTHPFSLLCAYAMGNFYKEADGRQFHEVCRQHGHVIPTERYTEGDQSDRLREITVLQQRARALETEIEHRKELERRLRETLAARSEAEEALRQALQREHGARAEAETANRAKSEFLAVMSHELRTPLNAIAGHVELVQLGVYGPLNERQSEALERVQRSQRHLLRLITSVLNLARVETGDIEYNVEDFDIRPLLQNVTESIEPLFSAKSIALRVQPADGGVIADSAMPLVVRGDREKVKQILFNLLSNAAKFTPAGGRVSVDCRHCPNGQEMISLTVTDNGIGIPSSRIQGVFEPFGQISLAQSAQRDGVGLGLAISRDLARAMGGELSVSSTVGKGTEFTLRLHATIGLAMATAAQALHVPEDAVE